MKRYMANHYMIWAYSEMGYTLLKIRIKVFSTTEGPNLVPPVNIPNNMSQIILIEM